MVMLMRKMICMWAFLSNNNCYHLYDILTSIVLTFFLTRGKVLHDASGTCSQRILYCFVVYSKWSCAFLDLRSSECTFARKSTCFVSRIIQCDYNFPAITPFSVGCFSGGTCRTYEIKLLYMASTCCCDLSVQLN